MAIRRDTSVVLRDWGKGV
jgi:hypothetical protein